MIEANGSAAPSRNLDLWLVFPEQICDQALLAALEDLLTEEERKRQQRFLFAEDRKRFLLTRAAVRTLLSRYAAVAPADWRFTANSHGRPAIAPCHCKATGLNFNLSHTRGLIAVAICWHRQLGVDVEQLRQRPSALELAQRFFATEEAEALAELPPALRQHRFFEYWTLKESYVKALGRGLSTPLDQCRFVFPHEAALRLIADPQLESHAHRWWFWQFQPTPDTLLALCAEQSPGEPPLPQARVWHPGAADQPQHLPLLRTSWA